MKKYSLRKLFQQAIGSGHYGHKGRPGQRGGSLPGTGGSHQKISRGKRKEVKGSIEEAKSFSSGYFGKPVKYEEFLEGGPGLHKGTINSLRETEVLSVEEGRVRVKVPYGFGSLGVSTIEGSLPRVGDTVKLVQEHKTGPRGNTTSAWNYIVTQDY